MSVSLPGGFEFPADTSVPLALYNASRSWQRAEFQAVLGYSHVLIEAERPLFGSLFDRNVAREAESLRTHGLSVAFIAHGTDIRSARRHLATTPWSYFSDDPEQTAALQADADRNIALLINQESPVFVSTPDLIDDVPRALWCPVVVTPARWLSSRPAMKEPVPLVWHAPSMSRVKGTHLISETMQGLHREGRVKYSERRGIPAEQMPQHISTTDILLDQFRTGSYGVAACEGMAAGRVVLGHVLPQVRDRVRTMTGMELPVVEATPDTLRDVILELIANPAWARSCAAAGPRFVSHVHDGRWSASAIRENWLTLRT
ncbi:MAG: hypothetical protein LH624_15660 [Cryobacterium sp.]|nr:hypothetical protein [Cryobacterium sp.]